MNHCVIDALSPPNYSVRDCQTSLSSPIRIVYPPFTSNRNIDQDSSSDESISTTTEIVLAPNAVYDNGPLDPPSVGDVVPSLSSTSPSLRIGSALRLVPTVRLFSKTSAKSLAAMMDFRSRQSSSNEPPIVPRIGQSSDEPAALTLVNASPVGVPVLSSASPPSESSVITQPVLPTASSSDSSDSSSESSSDSSVTPTEVHLALDTTLLGTTTACVADTSTQVDHARLQETSVVTPSAVSHSHDVAVDSPLEYESIDSSVAPNSPLLESFVCTDSNTGESRPIPDSPTCVIDSAPTSDGLIVPANITARADASPPQVTHPAFSAPTPHMSLNWKTLRPVFLRSAILISTLMWMGIPRLHQKNQMGPHRLCGVA